MEQLQSLLAKVTVLVEEAKSVYDALDDIQNEIQKLVTTKASAETITIVDPDG